MLLRLADERTQPACNWVRFKKEYFGNRLRITYIDSIAPLPALFEQVNSRHLAIECLVGHPYARFCQSQA